MRKLTILVVLAVVAGAVGYLVWSTRSSEAPRGAERAAAPGAQPEASQEPLDRAAAASELVGVAPAEASGADAEGAGAERADVTVKARLRGRVILPASTPRDEQVEVLASRQALAHAGLQLPRAEDSVWRTTAAPDGSFELPVPVDSGDVHVLAEGRYAAARESITVSLPLSQPLELAVELGTWVRGTLSVPEALEPRRAELAEVEIELAASGRGELAEAIDRDRGASEPRDSRTVRSADGRTFEVRAVLGSGDCVLSTRPEHEPRPSFAYAKGEPFALAPGRALDVTLRLTGGATLIGRVVDESGAPVAEAELEVRVHPRIMGLGGDRARSGKSDADGRFELPAVTAGKAKLQIEKPGYLTELADVELAEGETRDGGEYRLTHGARLAGVVLWPDRAPAAGAKVSVGFDMAAMTGMNAFNAWRGNEGSAETDASGAFAVAGLGAGPFVVRATAPPRDAAEGDRKDEQLRWRASAAGVAPGNEEIELVLHAPEGVQGRVVDETGAPVPKFRVVARAKINSLVPGLSGDERRQGFEDDDGRFAFSGLDRGGWDLFALAEGFGDAEPATVELPRDAAAEPVEIRLAHAATVSGTVLGYDGRPVAGATVRRATVLADLARRLRPSNEPDHAATDEQGRFSLAPLSAGSVGLVARADGAAASETLTLDLAAGQAVGDVVLRLRRGGTLVGEVYGDDGKPKAGANILVQDPTQSSGQRMPRSDSEGRFREEHLEPGTWQVIYMPWMSDDGAMPDANDVSSVLSSMKMTSATIREGEETHVTLGAPPKNPVRVHGRVVSHGEPVGGVTVTFMADGGKGLDSLSFTTVGADGAYETRLDGAGRYLITVQSFGGAGEQQAYEFAHRVPQGEEYALDLELPSARISGRVLDADGNPAPRTRVSLTPRGAVPNGTILGGRYSEITTDERGGYVMRWLEPGDYSLAAGGAVFGGMFGADDPLGREVRDITVAAEADMRDVDFRLKASGAIAGLVRSADGKPVAGAAIFVRDEHDRLVERLSLSQTAGDGRFTYHGLAPGRYTVHSRSTTETCAAPVAAEVRSGETTEIALMIDAGTVLVVKLVDAKEDEVEAEVLVSDEKGRQVNGVLTMAELMAVFQEGGFSSTEQRIGPLAPGLYTVTATAPDGRKASKTVSLAGGGERKLTLRLRE